MYHEYFPCLTSGIFPLYTNKWYHEKLRLFAEKFFGICIGGYHGDLLPWYLRFFTKEF